MRLKPCSAMTSENESKTAWEDLNLSPKGARRVRALASASRSRSIPITVRSSKRSRRASVWPPSPSVASTMTGAALASIAGASRDTHRSRITDMCSTYSPFPIHFPHYFLFFTHLWSPPADGFISIATPGKRRRCRPTLM